MESCPIRRGPCLPTAIRQLGALLKRLAELDEAILILRRRSHGKKNSGFTVGDSLPTPGGNDIDQDKTSLTASVRDEQPSTSRKGSRGRKRGSAHGEEGREGRGSLSKRKRSSDGSRPSALTATLDSNDDDDDHHHGDMHDKDETSTVAVSDGGRGDDKAETGPRAKRAASSKSSRGTTSSGSTSSGKPDPKKEMEAAMLSLLVLIDENTASIDNDLSSLESIGSASAES